jgi:hypothetical protein
MNDLIVRNNARNRHGDLLKEAAHQRLIRSISTDARPAAPRHNLVADLIGRLLHRPAAARG